MTPKLSMGYQQYNVGSTEKSLVSVLILVMYWFDQLLGDGSVKILTLHVIFIITWNC